MQFIKKGIQKTVLCCLILSYSAAFSQHETATPPSEEVKTAHGKIQHHHKNVLAIYTGTTVAPTFVEGDQFSDYIFIPTYGVEYARKIRPWLGLGVHNEIELQNYIIEDEDGKQLDREFIYIGSVLLIIKPINHLAIYAGPGLELTSDHNFNVFKFGAEYVMYRGDGHGWYIAPEVSMDWVSNLYTTFNFGISIGKGF